ncbi:MAG: thiol-disulfide isomerase [Acidobacteria bacterium]|nr:thiol-disulfide isomerase [Acidobacteriota bacterium]
MALLTYKDARPWARSIRDEVGDGAMPPWHADPKHGRFANDRSLSPADKETLTKWANGGAPEGDPQDLPPAPAFTDGWTIGAPDLVLSMPEPYTVPADGFVEYEYIEIPTNLKEDRWVQAFEVRPGNRAVVHHVIATARAPQPERRPSAFRMGAEMSVPPGQTGGPAETEGQQRPKGLSRYPRPRAIGASIGGFAPGTAAHVYAPGTALLLRAGSAIVLQMHYTTSGSQQIDQSRIGLKFAPAPPIEELRIVALANGKLRIPPGDPDYSLSAEMTTTAAVTLRQILPHTHLRGKSWEYAAVYPDGRREVILSVPKYDFNWQTSYVFAEPLKMPKGTKIIAVAHYDNSAANKANPDPRKEVLWGDQTWEEMMFTSFVYSIDGVTPGAVITAAPGGGSR